MIKINNYSPLQKNKKKKSLESEDRWAMKLQKGEAAIESRFTQFYYENDSQWDKMQAKKMYTLH